MLSNTGHTHFLSCLHCGKSPSNAHYICDCLGERWQREYRTLEVQWKDRQKIREAIAESYETYALDHPLGMLQYAALPFRRGLDHPMRVGLTPLLHLENISRRYAADLHIKCEGHNPSGCFKDRETLMCLLNSKHKGLNKTTIYSSGNAAASAAIFAQNNKIHLVTFVPGDTYEEKIEFITDHGADVIILGDQDCAFEEGYRLYACANASGVFESEGYDNWSVSNPYRVLGDKTIAVEIVRQMSDESGIVTCPDWVIVPTANGSCLAGIWKGFEELKDAGIIDRMPRMVSAGIKNASPVRKAVRNHELEKPSVRNINKVDPEDANIGSIILAAEGYDSIEAAGAVIDSGGVALEMTSQDIERTFEMLIEEESRLALDEEIMPEPASMISIAAVAQLHSKGLLSRGDTVVSMITGSGLKARKKVQELTSDDAKTVKMINTILDRKMEHQYPDAKKRGKVLRVDPDLGSLRKAFNQLRKTETLG